MKMLSIFQLPLSGSPYFVVDDVDVTSVLAFNSLSRDHRCCSASRTRNMRRPHFQLPLSGSHAFCSIVAPVSGFLKSFQLPLSGSQGCHERLGECLGWGPFQLPLSGSRARRTRGASSCKRQSFQLPLSGSLQRESNPRPTSGFTSFNSLSRDHQMFPCQHPHHH